MSKQVNYNENLCSGAAIRDDKGRRISKLFEASHPKMTVGYAKNLIMPDDPTEQKFNFRQSGGGLIEDGVAVIDKVKGNSVVWNQIIAKPYTFGLDRNSTFASWFNGGSCSINDKGQFIFITNGGERGVGNALSLTPRNTHKYLLSYKVKADIASVCTVYQKGTSNIIANIAEADKWYFVSYIGDNTATSNYSSYLNTVVAANSPETTVTIDDAQVIDLTQMFGAGNEPTTYEEFLQRKPKVADEYAYNEGTIVNNKVEKVVTTGRNLWDEQWENGFIEGGTGMPISDGSPTSMRSKHFIPIIGGQNYYLSKDTQAFSYQIYWFEYDANFVFLGRSAYIQTLSAKSNTAYVRVGLYVTTSGVKVTPATAPKTCINLSDPTINGQYFPYEKHELDLAWVKDIKDAEGVKLFEDGMRSAGTAFDEVGKNKAVKRLGVKVFDGNAAIEKGEISGDAYRVLFKDSITTSESGTRNTLASNGDGVYAQYNGGFYYDKYAIGFASVRSVWFCLPSSVAQTISQVRTYLEEHPITFIYELADPIEVEYDEKNLTYPVVAGGTEEAIASEPSTAFRADIGYGIDAVKTILDLKARVEALEAK